MPDHGSDTPGHGDFLAQVQAIERERLQATEVRPWEPPDPYIVSHADALWFVPPGVRNAFR